MGDDVQTSEIGRELALRIPHRQKMEAALEAARSRLKEAELSLERTTIRAPFNALVQNESVDLGQLVSIAERTGHADRDGPVLGAGFRSR